MPLRNQFSSAFCSKRPRLLLSTCNISLVFKIVLQDWNESSGNFKISCAKLKFPSDSFQSFRTTLKTSFTQRFAILSTLGASWARAGTFYWSKYMIFQKYFIINTLILKKFPFKNISQQRKKPVWGSRARPLWCSKPSYSLPAFTQNIV